MRLSISDGGWLIGAPVARPKMRLFCFAYAGGNAAEYLDWQAPLGGDIELRGVQLPGRGARWAEDPPTELDSVVETVARVVRANATLPFAFFGHSFGALLAFEVARFCRRQGWPLPMHLFASGCDAPQLFVAEAWHSVDDAELIDMLHRLDGMPPELLAHEELIQMLLPMLRADFGLVAGYGYRRGPRLTMPITVLAGTADVLVDPTRLHEWGLETDAGCVMRFFPGGHFFLRESAAEVVTLVRQTLAEHIAAATLG